MGCLESFSQDTSGFAQHLTVLATFIVHFLPNKKNTGAEVLYFELGSVQVPDQHEIM